MSSPPGEVTAFSAVEQRLASGTPFGSHDFISTRVARVHVQLLTLLGAQSQGAQHLLEVLRTLDGARTRVVLRDSLLRRTIEDGTGAVRGLDSIGEDLLDELLHAAADAASGEQLTLLGDPGLSTVFARRERGSGCVWLGAAEGSAAGSRFEDQVLRRLPGLRLRRPDAEQVALLEAANRLAVQVAPDLADSTLAHTCVVVVGDFDGAGHLFSALTLPGLAGVVVVSPQAIRSGIDLAELLVHESSQLKLLDIDYISPLFAPGFRPQSSPLVTPTWHEDDPLHHEWSVDRVLTSMHAYLTLAVFFGHAATGADEDAMTAEDAEARVEQSRTRALGLFEAAHQHLEVLTPAGRDFVADVGEMLEELSG
ncbi:aKG-HExxH-type peptide beta-hydroxylase [Knoellia sp. LjRoot47]|uniref:aKG-HExxH-type peptide beta-hydroxylase n=1 Tax=Knoellia sp. LjRoot47 TaxID=3342330 RepID=UPI003ECDB10E